MKRLVLICLLILTVVLSCVACSTSTDEHIVVGKAIKVTLCINGDKVTLDNADDNFTKIDKKVTTMLNSAKEDPNAFEQPKMICDDFTVENEKSSWDIWFEFHFEEGKYKKIFFTMNTEDTQTIWIYATSTESYDAGKLLKYYSCNCKDVLTLLDSYNAE